MSDELQGQQLPKSEVNATPYALKFGIIGGLICIVVSVILYITGLQFESWANWLNTLVLLAVIIIGLRTINREHPGLEVGFGTLFGAGMIITLTVGILSVAYFLIYVYVIDTDFINATMEISRQKMQERGMSEDQIEKALYISAKIMTPPVMACIAMITTLLLGALISVISAAIFKKEK
jgi:hypothetical protein